MPTMQELERALVNADRAGDTNAARALVQEIKNFQAQPSQPQGDTSLSTAFQYTDATSQANTLDYAADLNQSLDQGFLGDATRFGQQNIANPIREFFGFDPITPEDQNAANRDYEAATRARAESDRDRAAAMNYQSLTTDDVTGVGSAVQYGAQKMAESAPYLLMAGTMSPVMMAGEVNEELKTIEGLPLDQRVAYATSGGALMGLLEQFGARAVIKGLPKELIGKMGVKGVAALLEKNGLGRIVKSFMGAAAAEGLTETAQDATKMATATVAGKEYSAEEVQRNLKESFFAGAAGGGGFRASGTAISETAKAASNAAENMDGLKAIHGGDKEALADVSRDVVQLSSQFNDRNPTKSLDDADATLRDLHTAYMKQFDEAKRRAQSAGIDTSSADFATAERRAKNRAKNEASNADIDYLSQVDPELGALARKLNVITRFTQKGVKGGVSQFTDLLNPIEGLKKSGTFGRGVGGMQATGASALAAYTSGGTIAASVGGRLIDAATGSRNRVNKAINKYSNRAGIDTSGQGQVQQNEAAATAQSEALTRAKATQAANLQQQNIANLKAGYDSVGGAEAAMRQRTGLNRPQTAVALRSLKRSRPDLVPTIKSYEESLKTGSRVGEQSREFYNLQDAIVGRAKELGMEVNETNQNQMLQPNSMASNFARGGIGNPIAYQATVDNAMRTAQVAVDNAPTPELAQLANKVANARTKALKQAQLEEAVANNPEHKDYLLNVVAPLVEFGPVETKQESRFGDAPDMSRRTFLKGMAAAGAAAVVGLNTINANTVISPTLPKATSDTMAIAFPDGGMLSEETLKLFDKINFPTLTHATSPDGNHLVYGPAKDLYKYIEAEGGLLEFAQELSETPVRALTELLESQDLGPLFTRLRIGLLPANLQNMEWGEVLESGLGDKNLDVAIEFAQNANIPIRQSYVGATISNEAAKYGLSFDSNGLESWAKGNERASDYIRDLLDNGKTEDENVSLVDYVSEDFTQKYKNLNAAELKEAFETDQYKTDLETEAETIEVDSSQLQKAIENAWLETVQNSRFGVPGGDIIQEELDAAQNMYGERMVMLHHGTSKSRAASIDNSGFATPFVSFTPDVNAADRFAQVSLNVVDNGRISVMLPESEFNRLKNNKMITTHRESYSPEYGNDIVEYRFNNQALNRADIFRSRSLHKAGNKITDAERAQLVADALGNGFKVQFNASDDAYYRRQELITLTSNGDKRKVLHEIFHAVENRLTPEEMSIIQSHPTYKNVMAEVEELYPDLNTSAKMLEGLAETAARLQETRGENMGRVKYILSRIKDLIEAFKQLIDGNGFTNVNNILDDVYTGKAHQRQINEHYADLYVPDIAYAKKDKPGGPMVAKRLAALDKIQELAKNAKTIAPTINSQYDEAMANIANNLGLPSVTPEVLKKTLSRVTPNTDLGMIAADYLRAIGVMNDQGIVNKDPDADIDEVVAQYRQDFLVLLKALQKAGVIGDFGLAFRTSAGGRMYPVHMLVPTLPALEAKAELNNVRKFENRAKPTHWEGKIEINGHPFGNYDNTEAFIDREQKQALVINDKIYEMMDKMQSTPQIHRGLDLIYKKDGTTDSAYTLAAAEALKQYKDNQGENGGMTPLFMKRRAQDRLRVDTLNGSASYQGKAGKAVWEFPNWEPLGESGFEQMLHSMRDHFGISNELPYNERVGFLFGTVGQYMQLAGRPASDAIPQSDLDMPLIDYLVNAYGQDGSYVFSHTRGGTPKLFLDKQSGTILYQKNHALFDVADHGFEIQRAAIELGRMRSYLENIVPGAKKIPSSELFMMPESQQALSDFRSSYPVWFDGTSSSYQLHAVLTGDANLAQETNIGLMDPDGPGGDLYRPGAEYLQRALDLPQTKTRKITKKFISNRRSYGQVKLTALKSGADEIAKSVPAYAERDEGGQWPQQIKDSLKQIQNDLELQFDTRFPGAAMAEGVAKSIASTMYNMQGQDMFAVRVPLPDGDVAVYTGKLPDSAKKRVKWNIDKDKNIAVPVFEDKKAITGFAAFLNHSLDAYVQRELAKRLRANGATGFMHTHDAFAVHAKNGELMRQLYWQILREIAGQPIYQKILEANGLDPNSMSVRYNITTPEGSQTAERPMADVLQQIEQQKSMTFGQEAEPNFYALS